ncbi:MAG: M23 family metallopeptidase [Methylocystis sp.]|nr:M23 family metallopeptidase [Methylocystis sp.]
MSLAGAALIGAAGYLLFRDDMLAGLLARQTRMQYAYEDRIAALRLRLDQMASRQFIDQDGVEGKVQNLVIRQAQLETRAAMVAKLVEGAGVAEQASLVPQSPDAKRSGLRPVPPTLSQAAKSAAATTDADAPPYAAKPQPEGMDLRLGHDDAGGGADDPPPGQKGAHDQTPIDTSALPQSIQPPSSLAQAADPDLPMPARLESLAISLDRIERQQTARLTGVVQPALQAAGRLRRAFDAAGLPVERYLAKAREQGGDFVGGPFMPADPRAGATLFERQLAAAQRAVVTLDGLRRALPTVPLRKPLTGDAETTSAFGYRTDPFLGRLALHTGVDLREDYGAPVRATAAGAVVAAGANGGYGRMVEIDHGGGMTTRYAHLATIVVSVGQHVASGAIIGRIGSTGRSTGPHLHYEVRVDGEPVDPARFLRAAATLGSTP